MSFDFDPNDNRPTWRCCICTKYLGKQGSGGDVDLLIGRVLPEAAISFGYGSSLDEGWLQDEDAYKIAPRIVGWICDECIVQRHEFFLVRQLPAEHIDDERPWDFLVYTPLAEHERTKWHVENLDFHGRRMLLGREVDHEGVQHESTGDRAHAAITSAARAEAMLAIQEGKPVSNEIVGQLLASLYEAEIAVKKAQYEEVQASAALYDRMRQQAQLLSFEDLKRLRELEQSLWTREDHARLWESTQWYAERMSEIEDSWRELLNDVVQIRDDVRDGQPVVRDTNITLVQVFEAMASHVESISRKLDLNPEAITKICAGLAIFFDRSFMEMFTYVTEHGAISRYLEAQIETKAQKKAKREAERAAKRSKSKQKD